MLELWVRWLRSQVSIWLPTLTVPFVIYVWLPRDRYLCQYHCSYDSGYASTMSRSYLVHMALTIHRWYPKNNIMYNEGDKVDFDVTSVSDNVPVSITRFLVRCYTVLSTSCLFNTLILSPIDARMGWSLWRKSLESLNSPIKVVRSKSKDQEATVGIVRYNIKCTSDRSKPFFFLTKYRTVGGDNLQYSQRSS